MPSSRDVVEGFFKEVWNEHNWEATAQLVGPDYRTEDIAPFPSLSGLSSCGPDFVNNTVQRIFQALQLRWEIIQMVAEGEWVTVHLLGTGRHVGQWRSWKASGKHVEYHAIGLFRVVEGKIVEGKVLSDNLKRLQDIGIVPNWDQIEKKGT